MPTEAEIETWTHVLEQSPLFAELGRDELGQIAQLATTRTVENGTALTHMGDRGTEVFVVLEGLVDIEVPIGKRSHIMVTRADAFGTPALVQPHRYFANATANGRCELLVLSAPMISAFAATNESAGLRIMNAVAKELTERIWELISEAEGHPRGNYLS